MVSGETIVLSDWLASHPDSPLPTLKESEQVLIDEALRRNNGNQTLAASLLGLSREALNKRLARQNRAKNNSGYGSSLHGVNYRPCDDKSMEI